MESSALQGSDNVSVKTEPCEELYIKCEATFEEVSVKAEPLSEDLCVKEESGRQSRSMDSIFELKSPALQDSDNVCVKTEPCEKLNIKCEATFEGVSVKAETFSEDLCVKEESGRQSISLKPEPNCGSVSMKPEPQLDTFFVKEEPRSESVSREVKPSCSGVNVKRESLGKNAESELYTDHAVKDELVLGLELVEKKVCRTPTGHTSSKMPGGSKPHQCNQSSYASKSQCSLRNHPLTKVTKHTDEKPYKCEHCSYTTAYRESFHIHLESHTNEKKTKKKKCYCGYTTTSQRSLRLHILRNHTDEKPFKCDQCGFATALKDDFAFHKRKHADKIGNSFICDICGHSSKQKRVLIDHMRLHTGEKPHKCKKCGYSSALIQYLKNHAKCHSRVGKKFYKCDVCNDSFSTKRTLSYHLRLHSENSYKCKQCSFTSAYRGAFILHVQSHDSVYRCLQSENVYKCDRCSYATERKSFLDQHLKTHGKAERSKQNVIASNTNVRKPGVRCYVNKTRAIRGPGREAQE
ncbi:zinc finger protein 3-like [Leguminivora glycinivorella]|uniref:zinc finger protein 3-like n=1 Tax=Leguminivora glycinivorella TaxID=1035111 RepID=UPI00200FA0AC|nr:zinc finger protein 3-like [Leguminivora glycinivorella]